MITEDLIGKYEIDIQLSTTLRDAFIDKFGNKAQASFARMMGIDPAGLSKMLKGQVRMLGNIYMSLRYVLDADDPIFQEYRIGIFDYTNRNYAISNKEIGDILKYIRKQPSEEYPKGYSVSKMIGEFDECMKNGIFDEKEMPNIEPKYFYYREENQCRIYYNDLVVYSYILHISVDDIYRLVISQH